MRRASNPVQLMQIIRHNTQVNQTLAQFGQNFDAVVYPRKRTDWLSTGIPASTSRANPSATATSISAGWFT